MKRYTAGLLAITAVLLIGPVGAQKKSDADAMFEAARQKETLEGDLPGAIRQYSAIVSNHEADRAVKAMALVHMAECYQKMGDAKSREIYELVVAEYTEQKEAVAAARARLGNAGDVRSNGMSIHRVWTAPAAADFYGKISPDGRYIPYTAWAESGDLFVHDLATGTERRITNTGSDKPGGAEEFAEEAAFSRDGKQLAYTWYPGKNGNGLDVELRVVGLQGAGIPQPRRLLTNPELAWIYPYDWSPDGKFIAVHLQRQDRTAQIGLVSVQDGSVRVLKSVDWRGPNGIFFSPDGRYLAYDLPAADDPTGQHDIFVLSIDGSREIAVVVHPSQETVVGWSPDGKRLLFTSDRTGAMSLWALPIADGKPQGPPEYLRPDTPGAGHLGLTGSGAYYSAVFNPGGVKPDIQIAGFDFAEGKFVSQPVRAAEGALGSSILPSWSPDGKYLAYVSLRTTHAAIGIRSVETGQTRELVPTPNFTPSGGYFWSLCWAPDGNSLIVAARNDKHGTGIFRIDARTGQTSLITKASKPRAAVLSPDGKTLYYRNETPNDGIVILKRDLASGEEQELIRRKTVLGDFYLSPDNRYIGVVASDHFPPPALLVIPTSGGAPRELVQTLNKAPVIFSPDGRYVVTGTIDPATKSRAVRLIPVEGGESRDLMQLPDLRGLRLETWAPDGNSFLVITAPPASQQTEYWRVPLDGSKPRKLNLNANYVGWGLLPSPDGRHVAFQTPPSEKKPTEIWVLENFLPTQRASR